jgi:hypothetical protein
MKTFAATLAGVAALMVALASPAAADDELSVSSDGVTFARALGAPIFDPALRWVPGDVRSSTIYVKNNDQFAARLDIDLLGDHLGDLLDSGDLHVTTSAASGTSGVASDGSTTRILGAANVPGGAVVPVTITASFDEDSPNATQVRSTDIRLQLTLTQTEFPGDPDDDNDDSDDDDSDDDDNDGDDNDGDDNGVLPDTGSGLAAWLLLAAAGLVSTGSALTRRFGKEHHHG